VPPQQHRPRRVRRRVHGPREDLGGRLPRPDLPALRDGLPLALQVYVSVQPSTGNGRLLWRALGAKTIELIHQNVKVDAVRDDLETLVVDEALLEVVLGTPNPKKKGKEIEIKLTARLRRHQGSPKFRELSERLEALKERYEAGVVDSIDFLKHLLGLAKDVVAAEKETPPTEDEDRGKAALTELFQQVKKDDTPVMVERIVKEIDEIVRLVRFPGWQQTSAGEREVKQAVRKTLLKYQLHQDPN
jgi:type I restriction enzyme R subunit